MAQTAGGQGRSLPAPKLPNLDLMRSFAVLLVVIDHLLYATDHLAFGYWQRAWIGTAGVYLFFIHTCMVLMWSLERHTSALAFYARRALRIYPLAIVTLLATLAFRLPIATFAHSGFHFVAPGWRAIAENLLLVQNLFGGKSIVGVFWTLPIELQMYLVLPFLFALVRLFPRLGMLIVLWAAVCFYDCSSSLHAIDYTMYYVPCFLPGIMGYMLFGRVRPRIPGYFFIPFLVIMLCGFLVSPSIPAGWAYCLCVGLTLPHFQQIRAGWLVRSTHEIAEYSYSIYLTHLVGLYIGFGVFAAQGIVVRFGVSIACTVLLTVVAHRLIERPGIKIGSKLSRWIEARAERIGVAVSAP